MSSSVLSDGDNSKKLTRAGLPGPQLPEERLLFFPQIHRLGLSEGKLCLKQIAKSQPREPIYVIKKTYTTGSCQRNLRKPQTQSERHSLVTQQAASRTQSLRSGDFSGAHYVCGESCSSMSDVAGDVATEGHRLCVCYTQGQTVDSTHCPFFWNWTRFNTVLL